MRWSVLNYPGKLHHNTPGWVDDGALFHIRLRAAEGQASLVDSPLGDALIGAARHYDLTGKWSCSLILLMPDHAHAMIAVPQNPGMSETVRHWKRVTKRMFGTQWQEGFFDHRLRSEDESGATWDYIHRNPYVRGICGPNEEWPWCWSRSEVERVVPTRLP